MKHAFLILHKGLLLCPPNHATGPHINAACTYTLPQVMVLWKVDSVSANATRI